MGLPLEDSDVLGTSDQREFFELRVEFSGLCLFIVHSDEHQVGVVMPDARRQLNVETMVHKDGTEAVPHSGYLRFDLGNLVPGIPGIAAAPDNSVGPRNEGVHRFNFETLDLGLPEKNEYIDVDELEFPDFGQIDKNREIRGRDLFGDTPPRELLMRMKLTGGRFIAHAAGSNWTFPDLPDAHGDGPYQGQFPNYVTWTRKIPINRVKDGQVVRDETLTLRITPFGTGNPISLTLRPQGGVLRLKIANLCAENPLEWPDLKIRVIGGEEDKDFKWLYRLLKPKKAGIRILADGTVEPDVGDNLPIPILDRTSGAAGIEQDCTGGKGDGDF